MQTKLIDVVDQKHLKSNIPDFRIVDTIDVHQKLLDGQKERVQIFSGTVIGRSGGGVRETYTVRRLVQGEGVERIFPVHSPRVAMIVVKKAGSVRRAKLFYLRDRVGKATKIKDDTKRQTQIDAALKAAAEAEARALMDAAAALKAAGGESNRSKKKAIKAAEAAKTKKK